MKTCIFLLSLAVGFAGVAGSAHAQDASDIERLINCDMLNNSPYVCVGNETKSPIIAISCSKRGFFSYHNEPVAVPRGIIPAGKVGVVKFQDGLDCKSDMKITTSDHHDHDFKGQDPQTLTFFPVISDGSW